MSSIFLTLFFFYIRWNCGFLNYFTICYVLLFWTLILSISLKFIVSQNMYTSIVLWHPLFLFLCPSPPSCLRLKPSYVFLKGCLSLCLSDGSSSQTAAGAIRELLSRGNGPPSPPGHWKIYMDWDCTPVQFTVLLGVRVLRGSANSCAFFTVDYII